MSTLTTSPTCRDIGWIYFIEAAELKLVKIGWSRRPERRLAQLMEQSPVELKILTARRGPSLDERNLHRRFSALRHRGEWFRHEGDLAVLIFELISIIGTCPWRSIDSSDELTFERGRLEDLD